MDLKQFLDERREALTVWAEFNGFEVELVYVDRQDLNRGLDRCKVRAWKKHQPVEEYDEEKSARYLASLIRNWRGLTLGVLARMLPISVNADERDTEVVCSEANKTMLLLSLYDFDTFVMDTVTDVQKFREEKLAGELPNSNASSGST